MLRKGGLERLQARLPSTLSLREAAALPRKPLPREGCLAGIKLRLRPVRGGFQSSKGTEVTERSPARRAMQF